MKRSVAIIGTRGYPSYYGGFETAVRKIAPHLEKNGWHVRVYSRPGQVRMNDPGRHPGIEVVDTLGFDSRSLSTLSFGLTAVLHAIYRKPDVALVMNCANGFWLPLLRLRGIKVVTNVDGIEWERDKWGRTAKRIFKAGAWFTAKFSHSLIFDAEEIARYWLRNFGRHGHFIPYGGQPAEPLPLKDDLPTGRYVLLVARFVPENTVAEFLTAAPEIAKQADVVLVGNAGTGGELDDLARRISNESARIHWLNHISDDERLFALWQNAAVYFHGHSVGGTNPALVQAMALKANIVARDTVYNREVLGDTARYCAPTPAEIARTVIDALTGPNLGAAAYSRSRRLYAWDSICDRYLHAVEEVSLP